MSFSVYDPLTGKAGPFRDWRRLVGDLESNADTIQADQCIRFATATSGLWVVQYQRHDCGADDCPVHGLQGLEPAYRRCLADLRTPILGWDPGDGRAWVRVDLRAYLRSVDDDWGLLEEVR